MQRRSLLTGAGALALLGLGPWHRGRAAEPARLLVIGATARSGREIIAQALAAGHAVTGLARTPSKLELRDPRLRLVSGDVRDAGSLAAAMQGDEVVICMVGYPTPKDPTQDIGPVDLYTVMATNLLAAMRQRGNRRLIIASSTGVETQVGRDAAAPASAAPGDVWRYNARYLYADMADMETMLLQSGLDVVILRPVFMTTGPAQHNLQTSTSGATPGGRAITYEDFAAFTLAQVTDDRFVNRPVSIYSDTVMDPAAELRKYQEQMRRQSAPQ